MLNQVAMLLENKLAGCLICAGGKKTNLRCFSHIATHPSKVGKERWCPLELEELGRAVLFDTRTLSVMNGHDITFIMSTKRKVKILHAVEINKKHISEEVPIKG